MNGAPFYVMDFVDGHVVRDAPAAEAISPQARRRRQPTPSPTRMAAIHAIDLDAVGLGDLGKREGTSSAS